MATQILPSRSSKRAVNAIAREAVRLREDIGPSLMHMHEALVRSSDPQTALAIAEQPIER